MPGGEKGESRVFPSGRLGAFSLLGPPCPPERESMAVPTLRESSRRCVGNSHKSECGAGGGAGALDATPGQSLGMMGPGTEGMQGDPRGASSD